MSSEVDVVYLVQIIFYLRSVVTGRLSQIGLIHNPGSAVIMKYEIFIRIARILESQTPARRR